MFKLTDTPIDIPNIGGYNDFPPEWTEITPAEYAIKLKNNSVIQVESRTMYPQVSGNRFLSDSTEGTLLIFRDYTGVATTADYCYNKEKDVFEYITKFWSFGCQHEFKEIPWESKYVAQLRCQHLWRCSKCGETQVVDSSD